MIIKEQTFYLKDICHYFGNIKALDIAELEIKQGSITGLTGPNGSGKSTLLKILAFALQPTRGQVFYKGHQAYPFSQNVRSKITLLTQKPYLLKRTVFENIAYGLKIRKDTQKLKTRVGKALFDVGLDYEKFANRKWHELSGGETQRVAMAARLILKPEVLLLDEPVASVDVTSAKLIRQASLNAKQERGTTLVIASHDLQWLYSISDKHLSMFNGRMFSTGIENIIPGPFEKQNNIFHVKKMEDGQIITLPSPVPETCNAVIKKKISIDIETQQDNSNLNQLSGRISSMLLEEKSRLIMTIVTICDMAFVLRLTPDKITNLKLHPGKKVIIKFYKDDIEWI
jgi:tungstate transport system ATP-binding protein